MPYLTKLVIKGFKSFARETTMNLDRHMNVVVGPNGSGKSARWDTEVLLASGDKKPIGELVEDSLKKAKSTNRIDDGILTKENPFGIKVFSVNPITMRIEESIVKAFIKRDGEPNLYTIKTNTGKEVTTTSCHPVMIYKNRRVVSEIVENLREGDLIATPNKINLQDKNRVIELKSLSKEHSNSEDFARFLGYVVGDGCIIKDSRVDFVNADKEVLLDYRRIIDRFGFTIGESKRKSSIAKNIYLYSREFSNDLIGLFRNNYKKEKKHIPKEILFGDKNLLSNFLAGLFDCDSSVRKDNPTFEYITMSKELAENVVFGLLRFGITARKNSKIKYASNTKLKNKKEYYFVTVEGKDKISILSNKVYLRCSHKRELLKKWSEQEVIPNTNNDLLPLEVNEEIKKIVKFLGIKTKPLRKKYPFLMTYIENRCNPTKIGLKRLLPMFYEKLSVLQTRFDSMFYNQEELIRCMDLLNISGQQTSADIGLHKQIIRRDWATSKFNARQENPERFYLYIKNIFAYRLLEINKIINLLNILINSDIFWDKIDKIEKTKGEEYVYDLTIEGNHNFIANNIFVHNSNITDALCFVLGRLSIKSMRAAKASHLIFAGNKQFKKANEAYVEISVDNSDKTFAVDENEIKIRRMVRKNGQSIYKINNQTKTRQEVLELLGQAGIDPHGFNIILQGEIERFVKMPAEERRKVIEEVAGISVYEMRKSKSLRELDKTDEKLKQINAILRERTNYLRNLENEREQALKFKRLQETVEKCKASIIYKNLQERQKEFDEINKKIEAEKKEIEKKSEIIEKTQNEINLLNEKADLISKKIQQSSGVEQDTLLSEVSSLKQDIAGIIARKENFENQLNELERREDTLKRSIQESEREIEEMKKEKGSNTKKQLEEKKAKLEELDELKRSSYLLKSNLSSLNNQIEDKKKQIHLLKNESNFILDQIENLEKEIKIKSTLSEHKEALVDLRNSLEKNKVKEKGLEFQILEKEKIIAVHSQLIEKAEEIKSQVSKLDICPLCKTTITKEHINHVIEKANADISKFKSILESNKKQIKENKKENENLNNEILKQNSEINTREIDIVKLNAMNDKKQQLKRNSSQIEIFEKELSNLQNKKKVSDSKFSQIKISEEDYENLRLEVNELQRTEERNLGVEITTKQRELERTKLIIKQIKRDKESIEEDFKDLEDDLEEKQSAVEKKEEQAEIVKRKYQKMFVEKNQLQDKVRIFESSLMKTQNDKRQYENNINNFMISKAEIKAKKDSLSEELKEFENIGIINLPTEKLKHRLRTSLEILSRIGNVNLRALEVYDDIKAEYDKIKEKVEQLEKEKEEILKIIEQIDRKKKKNFLQTLKEINTLFSRNFSQLSSKGSVTLEPQDKKEIFNAGLDIVVKVGIGKSFDVTSLSGGEQCLVALSLIFAIQEHSPYCFYIFDEIDAALDKRNSERIAHLLKKYMKEGQYIIITHNDALISESSNVLYGVSMQEGISKILSLEV